MEITIERDERAFDTAAAWRIIHQMLKKPNGVVGLSTGQTTGGMHRAVADIHASHPFDVSSVTVFNVDELTNIDRSYPGSCYSMILTQVVRPLGIPEENFIMPPTMSDDFERECRLFQARLAERGGVDLQILGIGYNGHIGINQPGTPFESETWVSPMDPVFEARVRRETGVAENYPLGGLTLGIKNIMHSRRLILVAKGEHKAEIIERALFGPVTTDMPASVVQLHPNCEVILDAAAASRVAGRL